MSTRITRPSNNVGIVVPFNTVIYIAFKSYVTDELIIDGVSYRFQRPVFRTSFTDKDKQDLARLRTIFPTSMNIIFKPMTPKTVSIKINFFTNNVPNLISKLYSDFFPNILTRDRFAESVLGAVEKLNVPFVFPEDISLPALDKGEFYFPNFTFQFFDSREFSGELRMVKGILVVDDTAQYSSGGS